MRRLAVCAWLVITASAVAAPPNVVIILVDDAGYMDFGGFGGEARTPTLDALADAGVRFSNYHTSPLCAPSRAMLLTGVSNHRAGVATIPEVITAGQRGQPGYALRLEPGIETVATGLQRAGYRTYMTGKWHLGHGPGELPPAHGFDRSFVLDASGADNFEQKPYMPYYRTAPWFEDGEPATLPEDFYSSQFIVDRMIDYVGSDTATPFFAYLAFQAIHIPIQAPRPFIERYAGTYDAGWDALRTARWKRARAIGLIDPDAPLPPMHPSLDPWDSLSAADQRYYRKSMEVNAAMLDAMDHYLGQFVAFLRSRGDFDNTLFIVTSDNGPEFNEPAQSPLMRFWMARNGYHNDVETLGEPGSLAHIGPEWASAASSPGRLFKFQATEGGLRVPLIVSGPGVHARAGFVDAPAFVIDLAPTVLDAAGALERPQSLDGVTLLPLLRGAPDGSLEARDVGMEVSGNAALFRGDFKLSRVTLPYGDERWKLFDIRRDPGETRDLARDIPDMFDAMMLAYRRYADAVGVIPPPPGFNPVEQVTANALRRQLGFYRLEIVLLLALIVVPVLALRIRRRRRQRARA